MSEEEYCERICQLEKELKEEKEKNKKLEKDNKQLDILVKEKSKDIGYMVLNYISKDKIREILENYKYTEITDNDNVVKFYKEIKELLEE